MTTLGKKDGALNRAKSCLLFKLGNPKMVILSQSDFTQADAVALTRRSPEDVQSPASKAKLTGCPTTTHHMESWQKQQHQPVKCVVFLMLPDDEDVWRLLLGQLWTQPAEQLLCRLLCTTAAMAHLVHDLCVGKAGTTLRTRPGGNSRSRSRQQQQLQPL